MIDPRNPAPLYQQLAEQIRDQVASGELPVGGRLPPQRDLAVQHGVSLMTVKQAMTGLVREGILYSRVGRGTFVARRPHPSGRRSGLLFGFVLRDLESPYFSLIAHAAQQAADALGVGLLFSSSSHSLDREEEQIQRFLQLGVDGLIIASMSRTYRLNANVQRLSDEGHPFVMVSFTEGDHVPFIGTDLERTGFLATEHLIRSGHQRIGYISDRRHSGPGDLRKRGYARALEQYGTTPLPQFEFEYPYDGEWNDYRSGYAVGERIASLPDRPDAMFVFNDLGALGLQDALVDRGLRVPEDVAVVGVDDIRQSARARVPLTTVRQPTDRIGALAVQSLAERIGGAPTEPRRFLEPELIVRASCGGAASDARRRPSGPDAAPRAAMSVM